MNNQVRILLLGAVVALALGWAGLRRGNDALARRVASAPAAAERAP